MHEEAQISNTLLHSFFSMKVNYQFNWFFSVDKSLCKDRSIDGKHLITLSSSRISWLFFMTSVSRRPEIHIFLQSLDSPFHFVKKSHVHVEVQECGHSKLQEILFSEGRVPLTEDTLDKMDGLFRTGLLRRYSIFIITAVALFLPKIDGSFSSREEFNLWRMWGNWMDNSMLDMRVFIKDIAFR